MYLIVICALMLVHVLLMLSLIDHSLDARSLGFDEPAPAPGPDSPKPKKKKKKNKKKKKAIPVSVGEVAVEGSIGAAVDGKSDVGSISSPKVKREEQSLDWWKDMVDDFKQEETAKQGTETSNDDWWKELKSELQTMDSHHREISS